ncbi:MAG: putative flavoprotein involved in transport [Frankiaceae bacterium]|nr:putative flavoprotein involved in transport [Frankiaceae bacterium]
MTSNQPTAAVAPASSGTTDGPAYDVVVIGGGQAGLSMAWYLQRHGLRFQILEAGPEVGHMWRARWDTLTLFSPARYDSLPGLPFPAPDDSYPGKDAVADYLTAYAATFELPVRLNSRVTRLRRADGLFELVTAGGTVRTRQVVVATGPFQTPFIPPVAREMAPDVHQLHSSDYRNPEALPDGPALVVGAGNSGLQIAGELVRSRDVDLAVGSASPALPQRLLGRDLFWWLTKLHLIGKPADSRLGRRMRTRGEFTIGSNRKQLAAAGVRFRSRVTAAEGSSVALADGTTVTPRSVIWATGFRPDYSWLDVDGVFAEGHVRHTSGVTEVPGLYFLGLSWQRSRGSALLGFVADDAAPLADQIARRASVPSQGA